MDRPRVLVSVRWLALCAAMLLVWGSASTTAQTIAPQMVADINPGPTGSLPPNTSVLTWNVWRYFGADDGTTGYEL